ncbi:hypothetical protein MAR_024194 [Mya arenaria]|uniref:Uncharacterized protein n=1 Tax=Mya arenaria TaxID=6604 RepID=A0ABY7DSI6_MYAAR|nr:hypothetical protein MAR_024194 [Mya arenaria]
MPNEQKEHERYLKKKERILVKSIDNMTPREQNKTRRAWRKSQRARTKRIKDMNAMMTPPTIPNENRFQQNSRREAAQRNGRRKKLRDRAKAYRGILKLTTEEAIKGEIQEKKPKIKGEECDQ